MTQRRGAESTDGTRLVARWQRLDRGWQSVLLGLAVVGLQWVLQLIR